MLLVILMVEKFLKHFTKKNCKKQTKNIRTKKRKGEKLYFKWKSYNNLFNSWIDKKDIVIQI